MVIDVIFFSGAAILCIGFGALAVWLRHRWGARALLLLGASAAVLPAVVGLAARIPQEATHRTLTATQEILGALVGGSVLGLVTVMPGLLLVEALSRAGRSGIQQVVGASILVVAGLVSGIVWLLLFVWLLDTGNLNTGI